MSSSDSDSRNTEDQLPNLMKETCSIRKLGKEEMKGNHDLSEDENQQNYIPSYISDRDFIFYPPSFENNTEIRQKGGKWLIFADGDLDKLDYAWIVLQQLCHNGPLLALKSSTAKDTEKGVIMCFTSDCKNKQEVKKAADMIRELVEYECVMYYKTNEASNLGYYSKEGSHDICIYMHTLKCGFYERDEYKRWVLLDI